MSIETSNDDAAAIDSVAIKPAADDADAMPVWAVEPNVYNVGEAPGIVVVSPDNANARKALGLAADDPKPPKPSTRNKVSGIRLNRIGKLSVQPGIFLLVQLPSRRNGCAWTEPELKAAAAIARQSVVAMEVGHDQSQV